MAKAERKQAAQMSSVASCGATDCAHNENKSCNAGEIEVTVQGGKATCATYSPEKPKARP